MMKNIVLFLLVLFSITVHSQEVKKEDWITGMKSALPAAFCNSEQYFRQCFDVTAVECEEAAASATRICLKEVEEQIPDVMIQPKDGTLWGTKVGQCAGLAYEASLSKKIISDPRCNDASQWQ